MLQQAQMADDVPNSSFDTTENVKLILKERRKLNEGIIFSEYLLDKCSIVSPFVYVNRT